jgi:hypothetical protein
MVTQQQAEQLAQQKIQEYLNACGLNTVEDAGNALMKLCSVAGVMMVATVGYQDAVNRLEGTAAFIAKTMQGAKYRSERAN